MTTATPTKPAPPRQTEEEEAAALGAALFDRERPGWEWGIDLSRLDVSSADDCPCGQLFGHYSTGRISLGLYFDGSREHGFTAASRKAYDRLTAAWAAEVEARRQNP